MDNAIEVRDLVVVRGKRRVLHGLSCNVARGSVTGLLGPSGSGKTTLIRCVVGVQKIESGTVTVLGQPAGSAELRKRVGYLTQDPSIYADLTVRENARYFASLYGLGAAQADQSIADVGLKDAAGQLVRTLSGGQDPVLRNDLWQQFHALADAGTTLLVSSHVMDEAGRCDQLILLREGIIVAYDTPDAIRAATGTHDLEEAFLRLVLDMEKAQVA